MKRCAWALGRDFNTEAFWAGVTAFVWYAFGAVPLQIGVSQQLGITTAETSSWIFIVWFGGAVSSICLSIYYRQPIPVTWTIPGLIYLGTLAGQYSFAELLGANLVAGVLITILGALGVGSHIMRWLPLPIVMGMFGGSILGYVIRLVQATVDDLAVAGVAVAGYLLGRFIGSSRIPPIGLAVTFGAVAIWLGPETATASFGWALPTIGLPPMDFSLSSVLAVALPMVVLAMGLGNVQGLGFLLAQGYQVPVNRISTVVGINSIVNALFGGHPASIARTGVAILASPDAGPADRRYWANLVASVCTIGIALAAVPLASLLGILPPTYIYALAGLAILTSFQDAMEKAFASKLRFGAVVAFGGAATPFVFAGITSAFWAVLLGVAASLLAERHNLIAYWREQSSD